MSELVTGQHERVELTTEGKAALTENNGNPLLTSLESYIVEFGFNPRDGALPPRYFTQFYLAQKLEKYIKDLKISIATDPNETGPVQLIEREVEKTREKTIYTEGEQEVDFPSDTMDIDTIDTVVEIPEILQTEWLQEEVNPELFYQKAVNQELLKPEWKEATRTPKISQETVKEKELVEVQAPPTTKKQHAYVLRDISSSTVSAGDGRDSIIRALALAFLKQGYSQGSRLAVRDFNQVPQPLQDGTTKEDLKRIAQKLLTGHISGDTDIQLALETAAKDIRKTGKFQRADILLLSDGLSELGSNPLGEIKLHTIIVGSGLPSSDLERWSTSYTHIDPYNIPQLQPTKNDVKELGKSIKDIHERLADVKDLDELSQLKRDTDALQSVLQTYKEFDNKNMKELTKQQAVLKEFEQTITSDQTQEEITKKKQAEERQRLEEERLRKVQAELEEKAAQETLKHMLKNLPKKYNYPDTEQTSTQPQEQQRPQPNEYSQSFLSYLSERVKKIFHASRKYMDKISLNLNGVVEEGDKDE